MGHLVSWYWAEVKGNVLSVLPVAVLGFLWLRSKHLVELAAHEEHSAKLDALIEQLDPDAETDGMLDRIRELVDETTPGGTGTLNTKLDEIVEKAKKWERTVYR